MAAANDGLRFLLELRVLAALGWWGFRTGGAATRWVLALSAPLAAAVIWALFVAPRASLAVTDPARLVLELAVFGAGVAALGGPGSRWSSGPSSQSTSR